jgi:glycosyltransferase involved in cell wall biosynthesis
MHAARGELMSDVQGYGRAKVKDDTVRVVSSSVGERTVVVIGALPPPVHGASLITKLMTDELGKVARVRVADVSPDTLKRSWRYHLDRVRRMAVAAGTLLSQGFDRDRRLYFCIAGGSGVYYDIVLAAVARLLRYRIFIHHHSFTYVNRRDWRTALLFRLCGRAAVHICLCPTMVQRLKERYGSIGRHEIFSNAALMAPGADDRRTVTTESSLMLGHLGNLTLEKGLDTVIALFRRLKGAGLPVRLTLAGPAKGTAETRLIDDARRDFADDFIYRGPLYGPEKDAFFQGLDAFLFPSRYANEAQPLVLFEAMAAGVPVIATCRGCVGDDVPHEAGLVSAEDAYLDSATALVQRWLADRDRLGAASQAARRQMIALRETARRDLDKIVEIIAGINGLEAADHQNGYTLAASYRGSQADVGAHARRT